MINLILLIGHAMLEINQEKPLASIFYDSVVFCILSQNLFIINIY